MKRFGTKNFVKSVTIFRGRERRVGCGGNYSGLGKWALAYDCHFLFFSSKTKFDNFLSKICTITFTYIVRSPSKSTTTLKPQVLGSWFVCC